MDLPFTHAQFLDVFASYNVALWPAVVILWMLTAWALVAWMRKGEAWSRVLAGVLAAHWAWSAIAYHLAFFRGINPAATVFAILFLVQAAVFLWFGVTRERLRWKFERSLRGVAGGSLIVYGMFYPAIGIAFGLEYPRMPAFGVPCPTALITAGVLLLAVPGSPRFPNVIPILWAAVGGSAAFVLGIRADLALIVAGAMLLAHTYVPSALGRPRVTPRSTGARTEAAGR